MKNIFFLKTTIFHKRTKPFLNFFTYKYPSLLLNLENMKNNNFFFSINKFNLLSFYSEDHGPRKKNYNLYQWIIKLIKKKYNFKNKLNIYLSDKKFSKQEQGIFAERFGKKAEKAISFLKFSNKDVLEKKVNDSFVEVANLLRSYKTDLSGELKKLASETDGDRTKKQNILSRMLEILGSKN